MNYWLRAGLLTLLEKGSGLVFALGTAILLWRGLPKTGFATWGLFLLITYFLEMGRSGLIQNGLVRYLSLYQSDEANYKAIAGAAFWLNVGFSVVSNAVLWASMGWLAANQQAPELTEILPVYFVTNFVMAWLYHCNFVQQANLEFRGIFWATFFLRGTLFVWVLWCWWSGHAFLLYQLALALLFGSIAGAATTWWYARPFLKNAFGFHRQWVKTLVAYGKYVMGTNLSAMFYKNIDKLVLGSLLGQVAFALYDTAAKITQMVETPTFSIAAVVFPQSARTTDNDRLRILYEQSVAAILALVLPFLVLTLFFAEGIVVILAGKAYLEAANILRLTAFFGLFVPFAVQFGTILDATGRPSTNFAFTIAIAVLNLALSYTGVRVFGLFGAAYGILAGYLISFVAMQYLLRRDYGIDWRRAWMAVPDMYRMGWDVVMRWMRRGTA
jgi:lipopolysaccharide exporter